MRPTRLLRVFRAFFGWIPGGSAVVCAVLCSFFTAFTGGSGVTILALGGVLLPALLKDGYRERFALGLLTASGSLGLLLPPSLPLILYGVVAQIPIEDLFIGGILPGILLTTMMAAWGVREGIVSGARRQSFAPWRGCLGLVARQVGAGAAGRRPGGDVQRSRDGRRSRGADGVLCALHAGAGASRPFDPARSAARPRASAWG